MKLKSTSFGVLLLHDKSTSKLSDLKQCFVLFFSDSLVDWRFFCCLCLDSQGQLQAQGAQLKLEHPRGPYSTGSWCWLWAGGPQFCSTCPLILQEDSLAFFLTWQSQDSKKVRVGAAKLPEVQALELPQCVFSHILLVQASHRIIPNSKQQQRQDSGAVDSSA